MTEARTERKTLIGSVLSGGKMNQTIVVSIERLSKHPFYGKYVKRRVKYKAHDEKNECVAGDKVLIVETRPISKTKRWSVKEILEKAK
ncbi:MAG: 30S ribosomal protein S17 [Deltaproteobacteria bacterium GWC2_56_8]|nr:MAG: 30S ribosomal protein S17 [Deltaproteobacteria bacterium GWB2_55_19]OGP32856.1 MAG: 30S ribosomal protein S17 [Deltaproteobacteria bacterium GWC2_56_8]HAO92882.1 30S ribosomal protein S17 [Deltaproteobacteria bacterium]